MSRPAPRSGSTEHFCHIESGSGIVLLAAVVAALLWANSPWSSAYARLWQFRLSIGSGDFLLSRPLNFWIGDGLMAFFFLLVGLEIRREIHEGSLATPKAALLPIVAAIGGIIVPALLYVGFNREPQTRHGWAIPTATDIAFATGALALLGQRVPPPLRVLLLAIAVIDDIFAVLLIAFVYSTRLDGTGLAVAAVAGLGLLVLFALPVRFVFERLLLCILAWVGLLHAGAHPALAGVILGLSMPTDLARRIEPRLHPWVAFGVMPLYAFANAGINLEGLGPSSNLTAPLIAGVIAGLVIGKPLGITLSAALCVKAGWCALPPGTDIKRVFVIGCMAGAGFTMSLFLCRLAFAGETLATAKLAVLIASTLAALIGLVAGRRLLPAAPLAP
jgi:NhaA family Na+:H+ antiporter